MDFHVEKTLSQANSSFGLTYIYLSKRFFKKDLRNSVYMQKRRSAVPKRKTVKY